MSSGRDPERRRLDEADRSGVAWRRWGPYLSERQWGTVREDYSSNGDAWSYFTYDQARSRAYRWGEDGLAGISDDKQRLCLALALWNGRDPLGADPRVRNSNWYHMVNDHIMSMPDKWEYPWFAAWDLAFHAVALSLVDVTFAKEQLDLLLRRLYLHPNGQIPAYEWNFGDVNPPVHAWATLFVYELEKQRTGHADHAFLENAFLKLMTNFSWWLNRKDPEGRNVFQGGFLGLDNIGVFDRSAPLPTGGHLDQADGTAWMALYCQNLLEIAIELATANPVYVEQAQTLFEHFAWITVAMNRIAARLTRTFLRDDSGRRPVHGWQAKFQDDPHWRDLLLFDEYLHGDNRAGLGASHQTGWTGLAAVTATLFHAISAEDWYARGREALRSPAEPTEPV